MPRWIACLFRLARLHALKEIGRRRLQQAFHPSTGAASLARRSDRQSGERQRLEPLEPRLLFTGSVAGSLMLDQDFDGVGDSALTQLSYTVFVDADHSGGYSPGVDPEADTDPLTGGFRIDGVDPGPQTLMVGNDAGELIGTAPMGLTQVVEVCNPPSKLSNLKVEALT